MQPVQPVERQKCSNRDRIIFHQWRTHLTFTHASSDATLISAVHPNLFANFMERAASVEFTGVNSVSMSFPDVWRWQQCPFHSITDHGRAWRKGAGKGGSECAKPCIKADNTLSARSWSCKGCKKKKVASVTNSKYWKEWKTEFWHVI